jgi:feruloyl esterase
MILACDKVDGVEDGIIVDPSACTFDPSVLVGSSASCDGALRTVSSEEAEVVRQILKGAVSASGDLLWYGMSLGTPFFGVAKTEVKNGTVIGVPYSTAEAWIRYFLKKDAAYNPTSASFADMEQYMRQSIAEYGEIYDSINPDLSAFRQAGGKLLTWHGVADEMIPYQGTVHYRREMERKLGGAAVVDDFYRVFLAPGVHHCGGGAGPVPTDPLADLVSWVEHSKPPEIMHASTKSSQGTLISRNLCLYPSIWKYTGQGDRNIAESWTCQRNLTCGPICGNL